MIILEGPDGAGKTTLLHQLGASFDISEGARGHSDRQQIWKTTRQDTYTALSMAMLGKDLLVWDRLFFSELVYAPVVGRRPEFSGWEQDWIIDVLRAISCPIILCMPPLAQCVSNIKKDEQMEGVIENFNAIYEAYNRASWWNRVNVMRYDYTGGPVAYDRLERAIRTYTNDRQEREW